MYVFEIKEELKGDLEKLAKSNKILFEQISIQITAEELKGYLDKGEELFLLDVRTRGEFSDRHIEGSVNIPIGELETNIEKLPKEREIVAICAHGIRSARATKLLLSRGFKVKNLSGGMESWES